MRVKPSPGLRVRDPKSRKHIAETGAEVPETAYWMRRLAVGDVVPAPTEKPKSEPAKIEE